MECNINVLFLNGVGQADVELIRAGNSIDLRSADKTGLLQFPDVLPGDVLSFNGSCTGNGNIVIDIPTMPATPVAFQTGNFFFNFIAG